MTTIEAEARYVDGQTALVRDVWLIVPEGSADLLVREGDRVVDRWPVAEVRAMRSDAPGWQPRLRYAEARATVQDPSFMDGLKWHTRDLDKRDPVHGQLRKVGLWATGAIASVLVIVFVIVPALATALAPVIPV